jgi:Raf kinase inhibitor-like YbhB/YbcL family protein
MRRVTRRSTVLVLLAVIALLGSTVAALAASRQFGYHKVRSGLPSGLPKMTVTSTDLRAEQTDSAAVLGLHQCRAIAAAVVAGAPAGTQNLVVTMFDSNAPTGSGFWHWVAWDVPAGTTSLPTGAMLPAGSVSGGDSGTFGYTGPCPPAGDRTHHYHIRVVAVSAPSLGLDATTHATVVGFATGQQALAWPANSSQPLSSEVDGARSGVHVSRGGS